MNKITMTCLNLCATLILTSTVAFGMEEDEERRCAINAFEKSRKELSDIVNAPDFEQRFRQNIKERFDRLDEAKKEELQKLFQGLGQVPSN